MSDRVELRMFAVFSSLSIGILEPKHSSGIFSFSFWFLKIWFLYFFIWNKLQFSYKLYKNYIITCMRRKWLFTTLKTNTRASRVIIIVLTESPCLHICLRSQEDKTTIAIARHKTIWIRWSIAIDKTTLLMLSANSSGSKYSTRLNILVKMSVT